jgi:hypothetical protein
MSTRSDSYEDSLSEEQRERLYALLDSRGVSLEEMREAAPSWGPGPRDGDKPSINTLSKIRERRRMEATLNNIEATAKMMEAVRKKFSENPGILADQAEGTLDTAVALIGQEVIEKTLAREDASGRTAAARILLKRADQKLNDRRIKLLEQRAKIADQAEAVTKDATLTAEERQRRMKEIFGLGN